MSQPVTSFQRLAVGVVNAMPPEMVSRRREKSSLRKSSRLQSALNRVFNPINALNRTFCSSLTKPSKSRGLGIRIEWLPDFIKNRQDRKSVVEGEGIARRDEHSGEQGE